MTPTALRLNPQRHVEPGTCGTCGGHLRVGYREDGTKNEDCANGCGHTRDLAMRTAAIHHRLTEQDGRAEHLPSPDAILALVAAHATGGD